METITKKQLEEIREGIAKEQGLADGGEIRCYHCQKWGYNCGKVMDSMGQSKCAICKSNTASYQWCKHFCYVGASK